MRIRAKELHRARKRKKEAYKIHLQAETTSETRTAKPARTVKKGEA